MSISQFYTSGVQIKNIHRLIRRLRISGLSQILPDVNPHSLGDEEVEMDYDLDDEEGDDNDDYDDEERAEVEKRKASYQGATVIRALPGFYDKPIGSWDVNSLYPNIIKLLNLCMSVMGTKEWMMKQGIPENRLVTSDLFFPDPFNNGVLTKYYALVPRELKEEEAAALPEFDDQPPGLEQCEKNANGTYTPKLERGVLPIIVSELLTARSIAKRRLKGLDSASEEYKKYDAQQLGLKVIANSLYGATGVTRGILSATFISSFVTKFGRERLDDVKNLFERYFHSLIPGGDTDSIFPLHPKISVPDDLYARVELPSDIRDPTSPLVTRSWHDHMAHAISLVLPKGLTMVFEKFYYPMFVEEKKRAVYGILMPIPNPATGKMMWENNGEPRPDEKGTEGKRRSTAPFGARVFKKVYKTLVRGFRDIEKAKKEVIALVHQTIDDVVNGRIDYSEFVMTRYYAKTDYSNDRNPVSRLCKLYEQRGEAVPELGTRLKFVVLDAPKGTKFFQKVEDPIYAIKNNLKLDLRYYIENHLRKPIVRLTNVFDKSLDRKMFGELLTTSVNLLDTDPIAKYVKISQRCEFCNRASGDDFLCPDCRGSLSEEQIRQRLLDLSVGAMEDFEKSKQQCYSCVGVKPGSAIECVNVKCNQFAPRKKAEFRYEKLKSRL